MYPKLRLVLHSLVHCLNSRMKIDRHLRCQRCLPTTLLQLLRPARQLEPSWEGSFSLFPNGKVKTHKVSNRGFAMFPLIFFSMRRIESNAGNSC